MTTNPSSYRRTALPLRPWVTGKLYDDLTRPGILHLDAYVFVFGGREYLELEWRERGKKLIAIDTYWIQSDGLTPVWDVPRAVGALVYSRDPALHARVIYESRAVLLAMGQRFTRVSVLCHYVDARETDVEMALTARETQVRAKRKIDVSNLLDIL